VDHVDDWIEELLHFDTMDVIEVCPSHLYPELNESDAASWGVVHGANHDIGGWDIHWCGSWDTYATLGCHASWLVQRPPTLEGDGGGAACTAVHPLAAVAARPAFQARRDRTLNTRAARAVASYEKAEALGDVDTMHSVFNQILYHAGLMTEEEAARRAAQVSEDAGVHHVALELAASIARARRSRKASEKRKRRRTVRGARQELTTAGARNYVSGRLRKFFGAVQRSHGAVDVDSQSRFFLPCDVLDGGCVPAWDDWTLVGDACAPFVKWLEGGRTLGGIIAYKLCVVVMLADDDERTGVLRVTKKYALAIAAGTKTIEIRLLSLSMPARAKRVGDLVEAAILRVVYREGTGIDRHDVEACIVRITSARDFWFSDHSCE
jgi:hypothetical protein